MELQDLATELLIHIFLSCSSVYDVLSLSSACRRFRSVYTSSRTLPILAQAAEAQFGPLQDAIQLVTYNSSQPAHLYRTAPFSIALIKQLVRVGRVAEKWTAVYPFKKWKTNYEDRRLLTPSECYRLRRAIYRLWLYTRAFHNPSHPRHLRMSKLILLSRADLLHNFSTPELAEMADLHSVLRDVLANNICPSNGTIARKFRKRFPEGEGSLMFNIHLNYPPPPPPFAPPPNLWQSDFHFHNPHHQPSARQYSALAGPHGKYLPLSNPGSEGWGDEISHYYTIEDMLKLDPAQILWLRDHAPLKGQVEMYTKGLGEWFENNGDTFSQTLGYVLDERGEELQEFLGAVEDGMLGVAIRDGEEE